MDKIEWHAKERLQRTARTKGAAVGGCTSVLLIGCKRRNRKRKSKAMADLHENIEGYVFVARVNELVREEPPPFWPKVLALWKARNHAHPVRFGLGKPSCHSFFFVKRQWRQEAGRQAN